MSDRSKYRNLCRQEINPEIQKQIKAIQERYNSSSNGRNNKGYVTDGRKAG